MLDEKNDSIFNPDIDSRFMQMAIRQAQIAQENGDVPIGCVIVHQNQVIAKGYNQREMLNDPTAHAEMIALTQAAESVGSWRLNGCSVYVTLEPCPMCAGALVLARVDRLIFGCFDPKAGACGSLYNIVDDKRLNHRIPTVSGVLEQNCSQLLSDFFAQRRLEKSAQKNRLQT